MDPQSQYRVAVVGAGPAGLFAARELAENNVRVILINRDIKPGGLAEYGIYPSKNRMKDGLRAQFRQILALPEIEYFGNVTIGDNGDLSLADLQDAGCQAVLVTAGAQGTKWLGLPGEDLQGVYHAKDLVYHYNHLPPYSQREFRIGRRAAIIGAGNVMLDISRFLASQPQVEEIYSIIRRGPEDVKFTRVELEYVVQLLDPADLASEVGRVTPIVQAVGQDPAGFLNLVNAARIRAAAIQSQATLYFRFLVSPTRIFGNSTGQVSGLEMEENTLMLDASGVTKAHSLGSHRTIAVDTVVFAIGDRVDDHLGVPVLGSEYSKNPHPLFPMEGNSYEVCDPAKNCALTGIFVAGWSRKASSGLVGVARKDGILGARAVLAYLNTLPGPANPTTEGIAARIRRLPKPVITQVELARLQAIEAQNARDAGVEEFKFGTNQEMLAAVGLLGVLSPGNESALG